MGRYDDVITRLAKLENYVYNDIKAFINENSNNFAEIKEENKSKSGNLIKYKASKHQKANRPEKSYKKRCYIK